MASSRPNINDWVLVTLAMFNEWDEFLLALSKATKKQVYLKKNGETLLHLACELQAPMNVIDALMNRGLRPNAVDRDGCCCLFRVVSGNNINLARMLLEKGKCNPNQESDETGGTCIHKCACFGQNPAMMQLLLDFDGQVNKRRRTGKCTPLGLACEYNPCMVLVLLENKADVNMIADDHGRSPLDLAMLFNMSVVHTLLEFGADPNIQRTLCRCCGGDGIERAGSVLHLAAQQNAPVGIVQHLIKHGANRDAVYDGYTPRELAEECGNDELATIL
jgi:ankyrin repeat protein